MKATAFGAVAVFVVLLQGLGGLGALVTTDRYIVTEDERITEDQYVTSMTAVVEGTIDGDLTIFSGSVTITGSVTGNVTTFSSSTVRVAPGGSVGGSVNGAGLNLAIEGDVRGDVFFTAGTVIVEDTGAVGRDVIAFGGTTRIEGSVGRDVRGRSYRTTVDGTVGGDVDIATSSLGIGPSATIGGDVLYRSSADASIDDGATIIGTVTKLPAQSNFLYGIILSLANVVGFLGFVVAGLMALWVARGVGSRAVGAMLTRPVQSLLAGIAFVIVLPLSIGLLAVTLVGIPLAIVGVAFAVIAFIVGPVPAVTALGNRVMVNRGGLFGAFLVGAILWRLGIWLIPVVGGAIYVAGLVWGLGAWVLGALAARRGDPTPAALIPASLVVHDTAPQWEPPRAPGTETPTEPIPDLAVDEDAAAAMSDHGDATDDAGAAPASIAGAVAAIRFGSGSEDPPADIDPPAEDDPPPSPGPGPDDADAGSPEVPEATSLEDRLAAFRQELEDAEPEETDDAATDEERLVREASAGSPMDASAVGDGELGDDTGDEDPAIIDDSDSTPGTGDDWGLPKP